MGFKYFLIMVLLHLNLNMNEQEPGQFAKPERIVVDSLGNVCLADTTNNNVQCPTVLTKKPV